MGDGPLIIGCVVRTMEKVDLAQCLGVSTMGHNGLHPSPWVPVTFMKVVLNPSMLWFVLLLLLLRLLLLMMMRMTSIHRWLQGATNMNGVRSMTALKASVPFAWMSFIQVQHRNKVDMP